MKSGTKYVMCNGITESSNKNIFRRIQAAEDFGKFLEFSVSAIFVALPSCFRSQVFQISMT